MSKKRDEMRLEWATKMYEAMKFDDPDGIKRAQIPTLGIVPWETAWDAAIKNDERVLALVETLKAIEKSEVNWGHQPHIQKEGDLISMAEVQDLRIWAAYALTQYRESVKGEKV